MWVIGITGGIACGKSFVTRLFGEWGARVASADADARAVVAPPSATLGAVFAAFPDVRGADGTLDRAALSARVFGDPEARGRLETILHPAIFARMQSAIDAARSENDSPILAYEVPLLFEKDRAAMFDAVVAVICSPETQGGRIQERERVAGRPPLSPMQLAGRLAAQLPNEEKARRADFVIRTNGAEAETQTQAGAVWAAITGNEPPRA